MARIAGIDLPRAKKLQYALRYIYGIGLYTAREVCQKAGVDPDIRVDNLTDEQTRDIRETITRDYKVEGSLRTEVTMNIKRLMDIGCYRGLRHRRGLPVHGQRTRTNARTRKGRKHTVGLGKKAKK